MKKVIIGSMIVSIAIFTCLNVSFVLENKSEFSQLTLLNINALAQNENPGGSSDIKCETQTTVFETYRYDCPNKPKTLTVRTEDYRCKNGGNSGNCTEGMKVTYYDCEGPTESNSMITTIYCR